MMLGFAIVLVIKKLLTVSCCLYHIQHTGVGECYNHG